jgi:DNA-binding transcriptional LysR family regulator
MVAALPSPHRLAKARARALSMSKLAAEDFVSYRRADGPGIYDALTAACDRAGFTPHIVEEVGRLVAAIAMVAAGRGVTIVPEALRTIHPESVVYRNLDAASAFTVPLNLAYRPLSGPGPVAHFLRLARQLADARQ